MNCPDTEIGGLIRGSHIWWSTLVSLNVLPPSFERDRNSPRKKLFGSFRLSKYMTFTWPFGVTAIHGWNWSRCFLSWFTRTGPVKLTPPLVDLNNTMSAAVPDSPAAS